MDQFIAVKLHAERKIAALTNVEIKNKDIIFASFEYE